MQKGISKFLKSCKPLEDSKIEDIYAFVKNFWVAVSEALPIQWENPRGYFLTKGIGVYALMKIAADIYSTSSIEHDRTNPDVILSLLSDYVNDFDWTNAGPLRGLGGESGANEAYQILCSNKYNQLQLFAS